MPVKIGWPAIFSITTFIDIHVNQVSVKQAVNVNVTKITCMPIKYKLWSGLYLIGQMVIHVLLWRIQSTNSSTQKIAIFCMIHIHIVICHTAHTCTQGTHVAPDKNSYAWLTRKCDYRTDRHMDRRRKKWSLCAAMLHRRHNKCSVSVA